MDIKTGDKVTWSRAQDNGVDGPLEVEALMQRGKHTFAALRSADGRKFVQIVQPASLTVVSR